MFGENMIKLSERLQKIADFLPEGQSFVDIGTDHGYLPIYMAERGKSPYIILADINEGPMEIARENVHLYLPDFKLSKAVYKDNNGHSIKLIKGNGLNSVVTEKVDNCVIAGMGGLLIESILSEQMEKSKSFTTIVLQPRNAQDKLRRFLKKEGFIILEESLVRENHFIWEIIKTSHKSKIDNDAALFVIQDQINKVIAHFSYKNQEEKDFVEFHIGYGLLINKDPLLQEWLLKKITINQAIIKGLKRSKNPWEHAQHLSKTEKLMRENEIMEDLIKWYETLT